MDFSCSKPRTGFLMQTNNHQIVDYDLVLDQKFGKEGTPERIKAEEDALSFYSGQILLDARKEAKVTQTELARRINSTKSYISKVENGVIVPSVGAFYRIINALGMRVEVVKPIYPKSVIKISLCRTAKRNPLIFPI